MQAEADYLTLQAALAKARLRQSAGRLAQELLAPVDLRALVRNRPWWSLGGVALAGFLTGRSLRRTRRSAPPHGGGKVHELIADVGRHVRRIVSSALGAMAIAGLRGPAPRAATPATNGRATEQAPAA